MRWSAGPASACAALLLACAGGDNPGSTSEGGGDGPGGGSGTGGVAGLSSSAGGGPVGGSGAGGGAGATNRAGTGGSISGSGAAPGPGGSAGSSGTSGGGAGTSGQGGNRSDLTCDLQGNGVLCYCDTVFERTLPRCEGEWSCCYRWSNPDGSFCRCANQDEASCTQSISVDPAIRRVPTCPP
jgi:hypothetical protein